MTTRRFRLKIWAGRTHFHADYQTIDAPGRTEAARQAQAWLRQARLTKPNGAIWVGWSVAEDDDATCLSVTTAEGTHLGVTWMKPEPSTGE